MLRYALCILAAAGLSLGASGELSDRRAPGFALPDPSYEHYYDLQDYAGKVVLIDIMSTRCPHCLLASTTLEQVKARYGDKVAILSGPAARQPADHRQVHSDQQRYSPGAVRYGPNDRVLL